MNDDLFRELEASVREGGAILRGESLHPARPSFEDPDVKKVSEIPFKLIAAGFRDPAGHQREDA